MSAPDRIPAPDLPSGTVRGHGDRAVGNHGDDRYFAVSRRCRHQPADLAGGTVDADGCLVRPWHRSRYDVRTGEMVEGPRGYLGYHEPTPGYPRLVERSAGSCGCASAGRCGPATTSSWSSSAEPVAGDYAKESNVCTA